MTAAAAPFWCGTEGCTPPEGRNADLAEAVADRVLAKLDAYRLPAEVSAALLQYGTYSSRWQLCGGPDCWTMEIRSGGLGALELVLLHGNGAEYRRYQLAAG